MKTRGKSVAIIGAGIAGCAAAAALRSRGLTPILVERHGAPAAEASGNPVGLLHPRLTIGRDPYAAFHEAAYLHALRFYDEMEAAGHAPWFAPRGLIDLAADEEDAKRQRDTAARIGWPDDVLQVLDAGAVSDKLGFTVTMGGLYFPGAGMLRPNEICAHLAKGTELITAEVGALKPGEQGWLVEDGNGNLVAEADAVVIAGGAGTSNLLPETSRPPSGLYRGQISYLDPSSLPATPSLAVAFGHYLTPPIDGQMVLGATFDHWPIEKKEGDNDDWREPRDADNQRNIEKLVALYDHARDITATGDRAGLRVAMPDHLPAVGPAYDYARLERAVRKTRGKPGATAFSPAADIPGLYILTGMGARGFLSAPLAAEILADMITGAPCTVERSVLDRLLPCRFAAKELRRG